MIWTRAKSKNPPSGRLSDRSPCRRRLDIMNFAGQGFAISAVQRHSMIAPVNDLHLTFEKAGKMAVEHFIPEDDLGTAG
jgi:hypothetical protein